MKKVILSLAVIFFAAGTITNAVAISTATVAAHQDDKVKIKNEELPEAVKTTLQGAEYKDWTVTAAYHVKSADQYEVELKKDAETKTVKLGKDGSVVQ
jgi:hypothetical protein